MKTRILVSLLKKVKMTVTSEEFKQVENFIVSVGMLSSDPKVRAAAQAARLILNVKHNVKYED